ncbi:ABC transporter permease [Streptomyces arenae]|uniref:ABC transporter permease n=1 Tax=Streptomyces arenae TaxID=29301 RepID=UPI00265ADF3F|nr:ABC transporter permease [Streptomyces arenae]MCG7210312.1 ABC transporter permease [Streptomyces arenae]
MTALSAPAPSAAPHLTRWLLRLHRPALYAWAALVLLTAVLLILLRGPFADAAAEGWRQYDSCGFSEKCAYDQGAILRYKDWYNYATLAAAAVPFLAGAWAGGALLGKELESGTARLSWTQSSTPVRWLTVRLATPAAVVGAGAALLAWLHHLAWAAGRGRIHSAKDWYDVGTFHTGGPVLVGLSLAGLAAGALAGLLVRRTLPALGLGVLLTGAIWGTVLVVLLPHLWPALGRSGRGDIEAPSGSWTVSQGGTADHHHVTYHPYAHYWPLQLTATAVLLAVTALLTLGCFLVLRRLTGRTAAR